MVEDDLSVAELIRMQLEAAGHYVETAADGASGLAHALTSPPDLILADVRMPNLDGFGMLEALRVRERTAAIPLVFLSALDDRESLRRGMSLGADDFLFKPVSTTDLLDTVTQRLRRAATIRADGSGELLRALRAPHDSYARASAADPNARSERIGAYRIERLLARGSMSMVYLARHEATGEEHVLKVLPVSSARPDVMARFEQEYALAAKIRHRHVARIHAQGRTEMLAYIAMEHLSGGSLRERIDAGPISSRECLSFLWQATLGLAAIHEHGIVHRDLKPENLMLRQDGALVVTDFGIAKQLGASPTHTVHGEVFGTPHYMSPEQARDEAIDARSDLYSLGVVLYEMLTGERPFNGAQGAAVIYQHLHIDPPKLPIARSRFQPLLDRLLAKDVADRFPSTIPLLRAIRAIELHPGLAHLDSAA